MIEPELLLDGYRAGIFPMALDPAGQIGWFAPDPRALIPLDERFHIPHGLRRTLKRGRFRVTFDHDFAAVIRECAQKPRPGGWISEEIIASYSNLHRLGHAHSVETWEGERLVGGLYGVHIGAAFFGESMFHHATDASKVALVALVERLRTDGFVLLDTQWWTPHLNQFGTYEISKREYLGQLRQAVALHINFQVNQ